MPAKAKQDVKSKQSAAFIKAARAAECDEDPKRFEERLKRVVKSAKPLPLRLKKR